MVLLQFIFLVLETWYFCIKLVLYVCSKTGGLRTCDHWRVVCCSASWVASTALSGSFLITIGHSDSIGLKHVTLDRTIVFTSHACEKFVLQFSEKSSTEISREKKPLVGAGIRTLDLPNNISWPGDDLPYCRVFSLHLLMFTWILDPRSLGSIPAPASTFVDASASLKASIAKFDAILASLAFDWSWNHILWANNRSCRNKSTSSTFV